MCKVYLFWQYAFTLLVTPTHFPSSHPFDHSAGTELISQLRTLQEVTKGST